MPPPTDAPLRPVANPLELRAPEEGNFAQALLAYPAAEREVWRQECLRLHQLLLRYAAVRPKRQRGAHGQWEFTAAVQALCEEVRCRAAIIVAREPQRAQAISPYTLDDWYRQWRQAGLSSLLRQPPRAPQPQSDGRFVALPAAAQEFLEANWRRFRSPRALYRAWQKEATRWGWVLPSESWLYRRWREMPEVVRVRVLEGKAAYEARYAPYVPRNYEDLAALQVVCGDHSERDVMVLWEDRELVRPWLTIWQDLRTGLLWGWYLSRQPNSATARLAYADGVLTYGAQPLARPAENFYSYIYTDRGKDYCSHDWAGQVLQVHEKAADLDAALECQLLERRVGVLAEFGVKRFVARGYNAKEKPVERFFKDLSAWEANTFAEYCGAHPQVRPERWRTLYQQHQQWLAQRRSASPFMTWETYEEALRGFLADWQSQPHERVTLGGQRVIPREEFARLYTTRVSWSAEAVTLALLRAEQRVIRKNGVNCFQRDWFYWHPDLAYWKGRTVEIRYTERDYQRLWVVLPDQRLVEAALVTPTPLLQPNRETLQQVARARQREQQLIRDYQLLTQSQIRGETTAERVAQTQPPCQEAVPAAADQRASVHPWPRLRVAPRPTSVVANPGWEEVPAVPPPRGQASPQVKEYDEEDSFR